MSRESRREQRRWQRELEAELRALPTYEGETLDGGDVAPLSRRLPTPPRRRLGRRSHRPGRTGQLGRPGRGRVSSERRRTVLTVAVTVAVIAAVFTASLTPLATALRGVLGLGADRGDSSTYRFLATDALGQPVRWSSCDPIRYVVNPTNAPDGWRDTLDASLAAVSDATGLQFDDEGVSSASTTTSRLGPGDRPDPVLVSWADPRDEPELEGDIVGVAGAASIGGIYQTGSVILDAPAFDEMERRGEEGLQRAVLMHELGHLVGLDHVDDRRQLMYPSTTVQMTFGPGDLTGLRILGEGPCA
ncbi:matrixin family metalloprotease [Nocardioides rubriscoriae]|uniref:matrixin family metalloprotease n=1 Tax=Nocardioides rubriscoriae TaxID=642762 RepID=UPI0014796B33|nr:matrixin family metalloprotease [Nocardioides rubriscoriae]